MDSPNSNISLAFFYEEIERISCTPGVEQKRPHLTPGVLKVDFSEARIMSQVMANWKPPAATTPSVAQRVTIGSLLRKSKACVNS